MKEFATTIMVLRARAAKMSAEQRAASAKHASSARWAGAGLILMLMATPPAFAQSSAEVRAAYMRVERAVMLVGQPDIPGIEARQLTASGSGVAGCMTSGDAKRRSDAEQWRAAGYEYAKCINMYVLRDDGNFTAVASRLYLQRLAEAAPDSSETYQLDLLSAMLEYLDNVLLVLTEGVD